MTLPQQIRAHKKEIADLVLANVDGSALEAAIQAAVLAACAAAYQEKGSYQPAGSYETLAHKDAASGYAGLSAGKLAASQIPTHLEMLAWLKPLAASDTNMKTAQDISAGAVNFTTFDLQPDYARSIRLKFVDSAVAAAGSVTVATVPHTQIEAAGTVVVGEIGSGDQFKIRKSTGDPLTTWTYGTDFSTAADLNTLINGLDYVNSTLDTATITVTAVALGDAGNSIVMSQTNAHFTLTQCTGGVTADTLTVAGTTYTFVASGPGAGVIVKGGNVNDTATAIAARLTTDVTALGLTSATANTNVVSMVVNPAGSAGNSKVLTVDGTRVTKVAFAGGEDAGGVTSTVTVHGTDMLGAVQTEEVTVATTSNLRYDTLKAFATVTGITGTLAGAEAGNTLSLGFGPALGLPRVSQSSGVIKETFNGAHQSTVGTLSSAKDTYTPTGSLDGAKAVEILCMVAY
jgi:hypothetical protein